MLLAVVALCGCVSVTALAADTTAASDSLYEQDSIFETSVANTVIEEIESGKWVKSSKGWWYSCDDGSYLKDNIYSINDVKYAFNDKGYMVTGWYKHTDECGHSDWYHFASSGAMEYGWLKSGGKWYYLDPYLGYMWHDDGDEIDGDIYIFDKTGAMVTGWYKYMYNETEFDWFHFASSGAMDHGWLKDGTKWYYLDPEDGFMWSDDVYEIDDKLYCFDKSGAMVTGWFCYEEGDDKAWIHAASSGALDAHTWIGDYYIDEYYVMVTSSYIKNGDKYYWVNKDGKYTGTYSAEDVASDTEVYDIYDQETGKRLTEE